MTASSAATSSPDKSGLPDIAYQDFTLAIVFNCRARIAAGWLGTCFVVLVMLVYQPTVIAKPRDIETR